MKKLDLSHIVEGVRTVKLPAETFEHLQNANEENAKAILLALNCDPNEITVLSGAVATRDGQDFDVTAGWVAYQNEIFEVDATAFTAPGGQVGVWLIDTTYIAQDPLGYSDATNYNTHPIRKMKLQAGLSGSQLKDWDATQMVKDRLTSLLEIQEKIDALVAAAPGALDTLNELAAALGDDPNFSATIASQLAALQDAINAILPINTNDITNGAVNSSKVDGSIPITTQLGFVSNFNSMITPGIFPSFGTASNQPAAQRGMLIVARVNIEIYQVFIQTISNANVYSRRSGDTGATWDAWQVN